MKHNRQAEIGVYLKRFFFPGPSFLLFLPSLLLFASPARAGLIDRVVASVNNQVITLSEMNQAVAFNRSFGGGSREDIRTETLEGLINRRLLIQEARRLNFVEVSEQDIASEMGKLKQKLGSEESFAKFLVQVGMTEEQLGHLLGERMLAERFIEKKIGLFIRVSRDEAQEYFDRNAALFAGRHFSDVQKAIAAELSERKLDRQIAVYLDELRGRADIRVNP